MIYFVAENACGSGRAACQDANIAGANPPFEVCRATACRDGPMPRTTLSTHELELPSVDFGE